MFSFLFFLSSVVVDNFYESLNMVNLMIKLDFVFSCFELDVNMVNFVFLYVINILVVLVNFVFFLIVILGNFFIILMYKMMFLFYCFVYILFCFLVMVDLMVGLIV